MAMKVMFALFLHALFILAATAAKLPKAVTETLIITERFTFHTTKTKTTTVSLPAPSPKTITTALSRTSTKTIHSTSTATTSITVINTNVISQWFTAFDTITVTNSVCLPSTTGLSSSLSSTLSSTSSSTSAFPTSSAPTNGTSTANSTTTSSTFYIQASSAPDHASINGISGQYAYYTNSGEIHWAGLDNAAIATFTLGSQGQLVIVAPSYAAGYISFLSDPFDPPSPIIFVDAAPNSSKGLVTCSIGSDSSLACGSTLYGGTGEFGVYCDTDSEGTDDQVQFGPYGEVHGECDELVLLAVPVSQ